MVCHLSRSLQGTVARLRTPGCASVMKWSLGSEPVEEFFSARVPKSSKEVRRVFIHDIKEDEGVGQQEEQED